MRITTHHDEYTTVAAANMGRKIHLAGRALLSPWKSVLYAYLLYKSYTQIHKKGEMKQKHHTKLFTSVINNDKHVLSHILPDPNNYTIISGLGDMNLHWRLKAMQETFLKDSYSKTYIDHYNFVFCTSFSIHCIVFFFVFIVLLRSDSRFYTLN